MTIELLVCSSYLKNLVMFFFSCSDNMEAPSNKKPRTSPVMVEQTGDTDKVLIDQVRDTESMFEEVMKM